MPLYSRILFQLKSSRHLARNTLNMYLVCIAILVSACGGGKATSLPSEVAIIDHPAASPSGKYILIILEGSDSGSNYQSFQIKNLHNEEVLYTSGDHFSTRHTTYFLWDKDDRVWVYSGDVGTFFWEYDVTAGAWEKHSFSESNVPAPEFLKNMRPGKYTR